MAEAIAQRYASALSEVVSKPDAETGPDNALAQLRAFHASYQSSRELQGALLSPAVPIGQKRSLVSALCDRLEAARPVRNFLFVVMDHRRLSMLEEMIIAFGKWLDEKKGVARIVVASAMAMNEDQRKEVVEKFGRVIGRDVVAEFREDGDLLGGTIVRFGSRVYDGSLRTQLQELGRAMTGRLKRR